jgi:5'-methylthioadenosine phosphorylase
MILENLKKNSRNAQRILSQAVSDLNMEKSCQCGEALKYALITDPGVMDKGTKDRLQCIVGKYLD